MPHLTKAEKQGRVTITEANRRKALALAELREMERDERRGALLPAECVRDKWVTICASIRAGVLRLPDKLAPQVIAAGDLREAHALILAECEAILRGLQDEIEYHAR